jgi:hypothetical protein
VNVPPVGGITKAVAHDIPSPPPLDDELELDAEVEPAPELDAEVEPAPELDVEVEPAPELDVEVVVVELAVVAPPTPDGIPVSPVAHAPAQAVSTTIAPRNSRFMSFFSSAADAASDEAG